MTRSFAELRSEFPMLAPRADGPPIVYFDSAATSLKPQSVVDAIVHYYTRVTANVHRGTHLLSEQADALFDDARAKVASLVGAAPEQIVWTAGTTDGINQVVDMLGLGPSDHVVVSALEHHSNLLPYRRRARTHVARVDESGRIDAQHVADLLKLRPRLVAFSQVSNVLGTTQDLAPLLAMARKAGALTLVDGAQSVPRMPVDVRALGCDFLAWSAHKMLGPTGIGALYIDEARVGSELPPARVGGGMVSWVDRDGQAWSKAPLRYEAGTPHIAGAIGFGAAADFLVEQTSLDAVYAHEQRLTDRLVAGLQAIPRVRLWPANAPSRVGIVSFTVNGIEGDDVAAMLCNRASIMCRSGVHCAEPLARQLGVKGFVRASLYLYNTDAEVDLFCEMMRGIVRYL